MNRTKIISLIVSDRIMDEYKSRDDCLSNLITLLSHAPESWQNHDEISVSEQGVPASKIERTARIRLGLIPDETHLSREERIRVTQLKMATKKLVDYCASHPAANITAVLFNCSQFSYDVFCGIEDDRLDAICVKVGRPAPPYAMRRH